MPTDRATQSPKIATISSVWSLADFDSILLIDAGSDGFRLQDEDGNIGIIPTGIPVSIAGPAGRNSHFIKVLAPATGSLNVTAIYYKG